MSSKTLVSKLVAVT